MNIASRRFGASARCFHIVRKRHGRLAIYDGLVKDFDHRLGSTRAAAFYRVHPLPIDRPWYKTRTRLIPKPPRLNYKLKPFYITTPIFYPNAGKLIIYCMLVLHQLTVSLFSNSATYWTLILPRSSRCIRSELASYKTRSSRSFCDGN